MSVPVGAAIRRATPADAAALAALAERTFRETFLDGFAIPYPTDELEPWVARTYGAATFAADLANPAKALWMAEADGTPVGYTTAGPCGLPHPEASAAEGELYKLYVDRPAQGSGLAVRLFEEATGWLEATYGPRLWLGVWSGNHRAQRFYRRHGFEKVGDYLFPVGTWRDEEFIFRRG